VRGQQPLRAMSNGCCGSEAPAPIGQKAKPAAASVSCKAAEAITTRARAQVRVLVKEAATRAASLA
jgi:hypothetical protein